jgi:hypothetical protein
MVADLTGVCMMCASTPEKSQENIRRKKMSNLKVENSKKCLSILRQFINETSSPAKSKEVVILAINHLQKVTAGTDIVLNETDFTCTGRPRAEAANAGD